MLWNLQSEKHEFVPYKLILQLRFMDDIFMMWIKPEREFKKRMEETSQKTQLIKSACKSSKCKTHVLVTSIQKKHQ